jgi:hypothetical protein
MEAINSMSEEAFFRALVLQLLWMLIICAFGGRPRTKATELRGELIRYFDTHGNQADGAHAYRRSDTFPDLPKNQQR